MDALKIAQKLAWSARMRPGQSQKVCMVAVITKGGSVLATGENDYSRLAYPFKSRNGYKPGAGLHAELAAINKLAKRQLAGSTITVYGLCQAGPPVSTKPCPACMEAIAAVGIKRVVWFEDGHEVRMPITAASRMELTGRHPT